MIDLWGDNRVSGRIPKILPTHGKQDDKATDSIMTEIANPTQIPKSVEMQAPPTVTHSDSTRGIKNGTATRAKASNGERNGPAITRRATMDR